MTQSDLTKPETAMVLAAGLGTRMRPITNSIPKPLVSVNGKSLLDYALDALADGGISDAVINVHYLADQIEDHVATRTHPTISISDERAELLDSGGGVKKAMADKSEGPFYILNADSFWIDQGASTIESMGTFWNSKSMDMLLLLSNHTNAVGFDGKGDFFIDSEGRLTRRGQADAAPYIYAGAIIAKAEHFTAIKEEKFSLNQLFDQAIASNTLFGIPLDGLWLHVGTPESIVDAEQAIERFEKHGAL